MSKSDKLKARLCSKPKDFTYQELVTLLKAMGFTEEKGSGSRRKFFNQASGKLINLHQPHPGNILKKYALEQVIEKLKIC